MEIAYEQHTDFTEEMGFLHMGSGSSLSKASHSHIIHATLMNLRLKVNRWPDGTHYVREQTIVLSFQFFSLLCVKVCLWLRD